MGHWGLLQSKIGRNLILFSLFFLITLVLGYTFGHHYYSGFPSPETLAVAHTYADYLKLPAPSIIQFFGMMDASSYIKGALFFLQNGYFQPWISAAWPPGESLLIAFIIKFTGLSYYPFKMLLLSVFSWSIVFLLVFFTLGNIQNIYLRFFLSLAPLLIHFFQTWVFDYGLILSENLSLPLFIMGICLMIRWLQIAPVSSKSNFLLILSALLFALTAYFRGYFELFFGQFLAAVMIVFIAYKLISKLYSGKQNPLLTSRLKTIIFSLILFHVILIPWRIYQFHHTGSYSWQQLASAVWIDFWQPRSVYADANIPCLIHPDWCQFFYLHDLSQKASMLDYRFYRSMSIMALIEHPFAWLWMKAKLFNLFWFGDSNIPIGWRHLLHQPVMLVENFLIFLSGVFCLIYSSRLYFQQKITLTQKGLLIFLGLFILFNFILYTFFHYEPRYSLYLQTVFIYWPIWLFSENNKNRSR